MNVDSDANIHTYCFSRRKGMTPDSVEHAEVAKLKLLLPPILHLLLNQKKSWYK